MTPNSVRTPSCLPHSPCLVIWADLLWPLRRAATWVHVLRYAMEHRGTFSNGCPSPRTSSNTAVAKAAASLSRWGFFNEPPQRLTWIFSPVSSLQCFCSMTRPDVPSDPSHDGCVDPCAGTSDGEICGGLKCLNGFRFCCCMIRLLCAIQEALSLKLL